MKISIRVKMKAEYIYDLLLFHTYSKLSGFLVNLLGLTVIMIGGFLLKRGEIPLWQAFVYLAGGLAILGFTPFNLKLQAKRMMRQPRYEEEIVYSFDEDGILEQIGENCSRYSWATVKKAIATPKDIAFYVDESSALVLPKESFGTNFMPVMKLIAGNMTRERIYIR